MLLSLRDHDWPRVRTVVIAQRGATASRDWFEWWSQSGSNRRPPACKAGALPAELWPRRGDCPARRAQAQVVGLGGVEPPTSPLSGVRSNQLSYRPGFAHTCIRPDPESALPELLGTNHFDSPAPRPAHAGGGEDAAGNLCGNSRRVSVGRFHF